jgi:serine/threonine-protein kinase
MLINGRYRLQNKLGEGGMAEVWLALDEFLERAVAVKRLRPEFAHDETFLRRFNREAKLVAKLNSPHIVQVYDIGISGEAHFIAMEYVEGQDLNAL